MRCVRPYIVCKFCDDNLMCHWSCPEDSPGSDCNVANAGWGCPWNCIYEAIENECDFKESLKLIIVDRMKPEEMLFNDRMLKEIRRSERK
ncbi:MAG: hypothetical protein QXZ28_03280 [Candidatus Methanomethylicaceae archaeon]